MDVVVKVRDLVKPLEDDGWSIVRQRDRINNSRT
jgi:predicted RNA binding protein YcfA (HicA-like mRNA interferase family)